MSHVLTVNIAEPRTSPDDDRLQTGIDKRPTALRVEVRSPGPMQGGLGSGLVGDLIGNQAFHGGDDQAVYAYAREDLDAWEGRLEREIANGVFGENLTTSGVDVTNALVGERWRVGSEGLELEVSRPRIPCRTFALWLEINGWVKSFTTTAVPGAYLRVVTPGAVRAGDRIEVIERPDHDITVGVVFRALTLEAGLLPSVLAADALPEDIKQKARRRADRAG
ncbi:MOSC domain-containing protein [Mycolicibacterium fluoranthenivorans]|jgi:MOSC domain-containing protein YiiM|uniref:MOSC domain-containing protein YiiM n=1 Tax=Mycolicibacterium fluoranthenivorans TaxID=258505 RepID=A0A1G4W8U0_9MYCO|nr:MOSC domain-containing protein [Mycolicibacterium fluoranthenivorans]SCX18629.1 MOSC domain-containing protein YiiM [Mycolicibacterium fluoranthenivorans]